MKAIFKPKRLPRKLKKKLKKAFGDGIYSALKKGTITFVPWVIKYDQTILIDGEQVKKPIMTRYAKKMIDNKYYSEIKT